MTRAELRQIAEDRLLDAEALLAMERWSAAYYLTGYAVECALKSCILVYILTHEEVIFKEGNRKYVEKCWVHDLEALLQSAELKTARDQKSKANPEFEKNWQALTLWKETSRYQHKTRDAAETIFKAVVDPLNGVLPWLKQRW